MTQCSAVAGHDTRVLMSPRKSTPSSFVARHSLWSGAQARAAAAMEKAIAKHKLELVRFAFCDQHGVLRGKTLVAVASGANVNFDRLRFVAEADEAGFYCYHVAEHHSSPLNSVPVPGVYLGAVANDDVNSLEDINSREFLMLGLLAIAVLVMGVYPKPFTDVMDASVVELLRHVAQSKLPN